MRNWVRTLLLITTIAIAGSAQTTGEFLETGQNRFASPVLDQSVVLQTTISSAEKSKAVDGSKYDRFIAPSVPFAAASWQTSQQTPSPSTVSGVQNAPNTTSQNTYVRPPAGARFRKYVKDVVGPVSLLRSAAYAALAQARDAPPDWEQGGSGYAKRFGSSMGRTAVQETVTYGLEEALKVEGGFQKSTKSDFKGRLVDALLSNITARNRNGKRVLSIPRFAGVYTGSIVQATTWFPDRYSYKDGLRNGTTSLGLGFGWAVVREFLLKR